MLFWIFVIIAAFALITLLILCILRSKAPSKEMQEFLRISNIYEKARDLWLYDSSNNSQLYENYCKTKREYQNYLANHPNIENKYNTRKENLDNIFNASGITAIIAGVIAVIMLLVIAMIHISTPMDIAKAEAHRDTLIYELTHDIYSDNGDDVVGKKELYNQIREFNAQVASDHRAAKDFWIGIFVPDAYLDIEPIPLS